MLNRKIEIALNTIPRRNPACVIISTCDSKEITAQTILSLISRNPYGSYDIVLVDNGGLDHEYIAAKVSERGFDHFGCLVLRENVGGSGAFFAGQKACFDLGYEYLILSDNDAELVTLNGIGRLVEASQEYDLVFPSNLDDTRAGKAGGDVEFSGTMHYMTLARRTVERLGFINPNYFLLMDDLDYVARANSLGMKVRVLDDCLYFHPYRKISLFYNPTAYFTIRNHLLFVFKNPHYLSMRYRLLSLRYLAVYLSIKLIHLVQLRDPSIARTVLMAFRDFLCDELRLDLPENNFEFVAVEPAEVGGSRRCPDLRRDINRVFIRKAYFIPGQRGEEASYFALRKKP